MSDEIQESREAIFKFINEKKDWLIYILLGIITWIGFKIRTSNLALLQEKYLSDLDSYVFLRYAKTIVYTGGLPAIDYTRYVPLGKEITPDYSFLSYFIAYLYKFLHFFDASMTVEKASLLYPPIVFIFIVLFFFLLVRRLFNVKVALLSTAFLTVIPSFLFRSMSGYGDKEALATAFMFAALYYYVAGWQSEKRSKIINYGLLSGLFTGLTAIVWGGAKFIFIIVAFFAFIELFLNKFTKKDFYLYTSWVIPSLYFTAFLTTKYSGLTGVLKSFTTNLSILVLLIVIIDFLIFKNDTFKIKEKVKHKVNLPEGAISLLFALVISVVLVLIIFGPNFFVAEVNEMVNRLIAPAGEDRWVITVAENHHPYFTDWEGNFSKTFFYMFIFGSTLLFYYIIRPIKKHKIKFTLLYITFLMTFILSRYSQASQIWNGETTISNFAYIGSLIIFAITFIIYYFYTYYKNKEEFTLIETLDKKYIFMMIWFLLMVVAARGAIRSFYTFSPVTCILASFLTVESYNYASKLKEKAYRIMIYVAIFMLVFSPVIYQGVLVSFYAQSSYNAAHMGPAYNLQWDKAMTWAGKNTPRNAVFAHWWDYGYWVQYGSNRSTILDGANSIVYWNYLMGRYVLTGKTEEEALEFLKTHNATHLLIISDEIGKYSAYSSIGSDENYDRYSWITNFAINPSESYSIQETRNETIYMYRGQYVFDGDFIYQGQIFPRGSSAIVAFLLPIQKISEQLYNFNRPTAILVYNGQQLKVPVNCMYLGDKKYDYGTDGLTGCFKMVPTVDGNVINKGLEMPGGSLYISEKGVNALWVNLYLFNRITDNFKLAYTDEDVLPLTIYNGRIIGPLKIWEINYPEGIEVNPKYLKGNEELPDYFHNAKGA